MLSEQPFNKTLLLWIPNTTYGDECENVMRRTTNNVFPTRKWATKYLRNFQWDAISQQTACAVALWHLHFYQRLWPFPLAVTPVMRLLRHAIKTLAPWEIQGHHSAGSCHFTSLKSWTAWTWFKCSAVVNAVLSQNLSPSGKIWKSLHWLAYRCVSRWQEVGVLLFWKASENAFLTGKNDHVVK